jgi:uncharacterized protein
MTARRPSPFSTRLALSGVRAYQLLVRPLIAGTGGCRFVPSCSEYAAESIATYGALRGGLMAVKRLLRCHPLGGSGLDQVPHSRPAKPDTTIS